ncbi:small conductance mechanosensitive channel [Fusobacterium sp. PH5-29]|uniref:mechanosensitive ion channel family protein n=2 Tax=unclassified Fusobacterium TaxID=2648384 RepID=UPI003D22AA03
MMEKLVEDLETQDVGKIMEILKSWGEGLLKMAPSFISKIIVALLFIFIGKKIIGLIVLSLKKIMDSRNAEPLLKSFILSFIKNLLFVVLFFLVLGVLGIRATSLMAVLGTAGLAIGLALQGSLSNLAGGVLILMFRPFSKGDYISNNGGVEGTVDQIQIFNSILVTPDNKIIIVPNGQLANSTLVNFSKNPTRRLDLTYSVAYTTDIDKAISVLEEVAKENPKILQNKPKTIRLRTHGLNSLDFLFRVWVKSGDYWDVMWDCNENVKRAFDKNNIEIPYQKIDIYQK